jgi:hypothetical protein
MLFPPNNAGDPPSLLVEDGKSFTIDAGLKGMSTSNVRPRNVAALLVLWGFSSPQPPRRLSAHAAFDTVDSTDPSRKLRMAPASVVTLRNLSVPSLRALDPQAPMPKSVRWLVTRDHKAAASNSASLPAYGARVTPGGCHFKRPHGCRGARFSVYPRLCDPQPGCRVVEHRDRFRCHVDSRPITDDRWQLYFAGTSCQCFGRNVALSR